MAGTAVCYDGIVHAFGRVGTHVRFGVESSLARRCESPGSKFRSSVGLNSIELRADVGVADLPQRRARRVISAIGRPTRNMCTRMPVIVM